MKISSFLVSSALLAAAVMIPASAQALEVQKPRDAFIYSPTAQADVNVGQWHCFPESVQLVEYDFQEYCRYVCKWVNDCEESLSTNLYIDERIVAGYADCDENAAQAVLTDIRLAPGFVSRGFDRHNAKRTIQTLIQGESPQAGVNATYGTIAFAGGGYPQYHGFTTKVAP